MRRLVSPVLFVMLAAFGAFVISRYEGEPTVSAATTVTATGSGSNAGSGSATVETAEAAVTGAPLGRSVHSVALGWELLGPSVLAKQPVTLQESPGLIVQEAPERTYAEASSMEDIEGALAKGGGAPGGADLAIVPLAAYVASYERLRALDLEIVFVVGWSHGREAIYGTDAKALAKLATRTTPVTLAGAPGAPETYLSLFLLDLAGVQASRVQLVGATVTTPNVIALSRTNRARPPGKLYLTSAEIPYAMPIVAVVPRGFATAHAEELETWAKDWLGGVDALEADVPAAARQISMVLPGAPPVVNIIESLGQLQFASLRENAVAFGLSGRGAVTIEPLFRTSWRLWRDTGVLATPPPDVTPLSPDIVAALVRTAKPEHLDGAHERAIAAPTKRTGVLLVVPEPTGKLDGEAFVTRIGLLAGLFDHLALRVDVRDDPKAATLLAAMATDRFGLHANQLTVGKQPPPHHAAAIEVMAAP